MNADRFDALSQIVTRKRRRRGVVRALLGLAVGGGLLPAHPEPTSAGKKPKKPCGPCQRKKKGRCRGAKANDTRCLECGVCVDGVCVPGKIGCGPCQACDATGRCRPQPDDAACGVDGKCLGGICNERPTCAAAGSRCNDPGVVCCSEICLTVILDAKFCFPGTAGSECHDSNDCEQGLTCVGHRCG